MVLRGPVTEGVQVRVAASCDRINPRDSNVGGGGGSFRKGATSVNPRATLA